MNRRISTVRNMKKTFTLIELLVVIAIIAILASLLMPALRHARDVARTVSCASRARQQTLAWSMYADDNDGHIMHVFHGWASYQSTWWHELIKPYHTGESFHQNPELYFCPSDDPFGTRRWLGMNERLDPFRGSTANPPPTIRISEIRNPSYTVVFAGAIWDIYTPLWGNSYTYRHYDLTRSSFSFVDGRVQSAITRGDDGSPIRPDEFIYDPRL